MKRRAVIIAPEARDDLVHLYDWIADAASPVIALGYIDRIEKHLNGFDVASERRARRDDVRPGLRVTGFERRVAIAFTADADRVTILRILYGGQGWEAGLKSE